MVRNPTPLSQRLSDITSLFPFKNFHGQTESLEVVSGGHWVQLLPRLLAFWLKATFLSTNILISWVLIFFFFLILWLCWVFVSVRGLSLVAASGVHSSSRCAGLSLSRSLLLRSTGSRRAGSVVVAHGPSCSAACGIFPDQGPNPCPLHWQADSQPLRHQGSPSIDFWTASSRTWFGNCCRDETPHAYPTISCSVMVYTLNMEDIKKYLFTSTNKLFQFIIKFTNENLPATKLNPKSKWIPKIDDYIILLINILKCIYTFTG